MRFSRRHQSAVYRAVALALFGMAVPVKATNLLVNPSFEAPTAGGNTSGVCTGWTFSNTSDVEREDFAPADVHSGTWALWLENFQPSGNAYQIANNGIVAGSTYTLSAYFFFESAYPAGTLTNMEMIWLNSGGTPVGTAAINSIDGSTYTLNTWLPFTLTAMAPANTAQIEVSFGFTEGQNTGLNGQSAFVDDADLEGAGVAPTTDTWAINGSGDWNATGNWTTGSVPNSVGIEADFGAISQANNTVYSNTPITVGTINFNNVNEYVIAGAGSLTLQASTGNAQVIVQEGTQEINLPTTIASNTVFNVSSGATLVMADPITVNSGDSITQTGSGTVTYESTITMLSNSNLAIGNSTYAHSLSETTGSLTTLTAHSGSTPTILQLDLLSLGGSTNSWQGKLDIANNDMIVHNGNLTNVTNQIAQGYNGGNWGGSAGITSSSAASQNNTAIGVELNNNGSGGVLLSTFEGHSVSNSDVLIKYTYFGDANLDGVVNGNDYTLIDNGFNNKLTGWHNGDFNYDGVVNGDDYTLIDNAFNTQGASLAAAPAATIAADVAQVANASGSSVPEPASLGLLMIGVTGLLRQRRKIRTI